MKISPSNFTARATPTLHHNVTRKNGTASALLTTALAIQLNSTSSSSANTTKLNTRHIANLQRTSFSSKHLKCTLPRRTLPPRKSHGQPNNTLPAIKDKGSPKNITVQSSTSKPVLPQTEKPYQRVKVRQKRVADGIKINPFSDLVKSVVSVSSPIGRCSGFFINNDKVVTNRHCVSKVNETIASELNSNIKPKSVAIIFAGEKYPCNRIYPFNDANVHTNTTPDIAICGLSKPIKEAVPLPILQENGSSVTLIEKLRQRSARLSTRVTPDSFFVGNGATKHCADDDRATGVHTGHSIAWQRLNFNKVTHAVHAYTKPHQNTDGTYQIICSGDSGSPFMALNCKMGTFQVIGVASAEGQRPKINANVNYPISTYFEPFHEDITFKWIAKHAATKGPFYNSAEDAFLTISMPRLISTSAKISAQASTIRYNSSLNHVSLKGPTSFSLLKIQGKFFDVNTSHACAAVAGFPCAITIPTQDKIAFYKVTYNDNIWVGAVPQYNTSFDINYYKGKLNLDIKTVIPSKIETTTAIPITSTQSAIKNVVANTTAKSTVTVAPTTPLITLTEPTSKRSMTSKSTIATKATTASEQRINTQQTTIIESSITAQPTIKTKTTTTNEQTSNNEPSTPSKPAIAFHTQSTKAQIINTTTAATKLIKSVAIKIRHNSKINAPLKVRISYVNNKKKLSQTLSIRKGTEQALLIPKGATNIRISRITERRMVYRNENLIKNVGNNNCIKYIFTGKTVPTITTYCD